MSATSERSFDEIFADGRTTISVSFLTMSVRTLGPEGDSGVSMAPTSDFAFVGALARISSASKSVIEADFAFLVRGTPAQKRCNRNTVNGGFHFYGWFSKTCGSSDAKVWP